MYFPQGVELRDYIRCIHREMVWHHVVKIGSRHAALTVRTLRRFTRRAFLCYKTPYNIYPTGYQKVHVLYTMQCLASSYVNLYIDHLPLFCVHTYRSAECLNRNQQCTFHLTMVDLYISIFKALLARIL